MGIMNQVSISEGLVSTSKNAGRHLLHPGRWSRTALILVPVHLVAFVVLYFGLLSIIRNEVVNSHRFGARVMLLEAVHTLHPLMCSPDHKSVPNEVMAFANAHELLALRIYRADGSLMGDPGEAQPELMKFLNSDQDEIFEFADHGNITALNGTLRIRSTGPCSDCHEDGALLGAATMNMDMTPEVTSAHKRLERNLLFMVGGWLVAVGFVNIGARAWTRRSLAHIRGLEDEVSAAGAHSPSPTPGILLDPVAAELYRSLTSVLQRQQKQRESVDTRMHHTERLASLGQLAAGLAHEIKNPLAGIRGVMELMRDDAIDEEDQSLFIQIVRELDRVNQTIQLLLNFARPAPARKELTVVSTLLEESLTLLRPGMNKQSIELCLNVGENLGSFALDTGQIRQIITNLVTNAADAIENSGYIEVSATLFPEGQGLIISIQDSGPGINADDLEQIFEPFFTTKFSGTGLGLAVVRSLVLQHGGHIEVESEVGVGTTFFVLLPDEKKRQELTAARKDI